MIIRSAGLFGAVLILAVAPALAFGEFKPPASMIPPAPFDTSTAAAQTTTTTTTTITTTAAATNITTPSHQTNTTLSANTTVSPTTTHDNKTSPAPTTHNHTIAPTTHNHTIAPTTHNHTTASVTTVQTTTPKTPPPEPTPKANLTVGNYTVTNEGKLCVMVQAAIQVHVNNSEAEGTYILQPAATKTSGQCDSTRTSLYIISTEGNITMGFLKNDTTKTVYVNSLEINLAYAFKSGVPSKVSGKNDSVQLFAMAVSHSYSCTMESVYMGHGISMEFSKNRVQAFNFTNNQFGLPDLCKADQPNYNVAIAVGVILIILIVVVVLVYLISRRKRTGGYQSL